MKRLTAATLMVAVIIVIDAAADLSHAMSKTNHHNWNVIAALALGLWLFLLVTEGGNRG